MGGLINIAVMETGNTLKGTYLVREGEIGRIGNATAETLKITGRARG